MDKMIVTFDDKREVIENGEAWVYTDSLNIADVLEQDHAEVLKRIRKVLRDYGLQDDTNEDKVLKPLTSQSESQPNVDISVQKHTDFSYIISSYKNLQNKDHPYYKLSKDLLVLVMFSFSRLEKAKEFQLKYIAEFNRKEQELQWHRARYMGIDVRNSLTDNVKLYLDSPKWYDYMNFTNLVYESLYGYSAKDIRDSFKLPKKCNVREMLSEKCLEEVKMLESELATFLSYGIKYDAISKMTEKKYGSDKKQILELKIDRSSIVE